MQEVKRQRSPAKEVLHFSEDKSSKQRKDTRQQHGAVENMDQQGGRERHNNKQSAADETHMKKQTFKKKTGSNQISEQGTQERPKKT